MKPNEADRDTCPCQRDPSMLLVLSAPSGSGKTTLARRLVAEEPNAVFSVSVTTRAPRGSERDGVDYVFIDEEQFHRMVHEDRFAEWAEVHGNFYGTPREPIERALKTGGMILFDIDVQGGEQLKARYPSAVTVLVVPPSREELERRLRARGTDDPKVIQRRLLAAESEVRQARSYDFCVINDDLETALADLRAIVRAERARRSRYDLGTVGF